MKNNDKPKFQVQVNNISSPKIIIQRFKRLKLSIEDNHVQQSEANLGKTKLKGGSKILKIWENVAAATIGDYLVNPESLDNFFLK